MKTKQRTWKNEQVSSYAQIVLGCMVGAAAYPMFFLPNSIAVGGVAGISLLVNHVFGTPVGLVSLLMNAPLFLAGYRTMGKVFAFRSLVATLLFSVLIDALPVPVMTQEPLLGCIFGGAMLGVGVGLVLRGGATTGGSDMTARMVNARFQHISVGAFLLFIDFCVVVAAGFAINAEYALYALISVYLAARMVDVVLQGFAREKACYVISAQWEAVKQELLTRLNRGLTILNAEGGYSGEKKPVLLCLLSAQEVVQLKAVVRQIDEDAFVFITDAHEVLGRGFAKLEE